MEVTSCFELLLGLLALLLHTTCPSSSDQYCMPNSFLIRVYLDHHHCPSSDERVFGPPTLPGVQKKVRSDLRHSSGGKLNYPWAFITRSRADGGVLGPSPLYWGRANDERTPGKWALAGAQINVR